MFDPSHKGDMVLQPKVLGQFPSSSEHGLIPLDWILLAQQRTPTAYSEERKIGVDIARSGADSTVLLLRCGNLLKDVREYRNINTMEVVKKLIAFVERHNVPWENVVVDEIGIGAGVVDRLREQNHYVQAVNFGTAASNSDKFLNKRAKCYWQVKEAINPEAKHPLVIPQNLGRLCSELAAIEWTVTSNGKIKLEAKEDIKKRLGFSPDFADALALSYACIPDEPMVLEIGCYDDDFNNFIFYKRPIRII